MSDVTDALNALKTILATIDPDPEPAPDHVWVYPADHVQIKFAELPVIVVSQAINRDVSVKRMTPLGGKHDWPAEILVFLTPGPVIDDKQAALAGVKVSLWPPAMSALLFQNQKLNGTARMIGDGENLFTYRVGHIHFWKVVYFGIRFEVMVQQ